MVNKIRGTQDFLDLTLLNFIVQTARDYFECNHFTEIQTPILEPTDLFKRSLGLETDVVTKQMFTIATHNNQAEKTDESICLRPEATASTMRAFLEHAITTSPWKVFSWGPMFRYERPQKGRFRQFHQINVELIDAASTWHDVYLIMLLERFFAKKLMLEHYALIINFLGCPDDRKQFKKLLDTYLQKVIDKLCKTCVERKDKNIMRVFDCKNPQCQEQYHTAPKITDHLCNPCQADWHRVQEGLAMLSVSFSHVPTLVRGLDYYDKTVFEFVSADLGAQSAFCSGGRYDHLVSYMGGKKDYPSLGAALGLERLMLLLEPLKSSLPIKQLTKLSVVLPMTQEQQMLALFVADELQAQGLCTDVVLDESSLKSKMRKANKMGATYTIILGPNEQETGEAMVKHMQTGAEERIAQVALAEYLA